MKTNKHLIRIFTFALIAIMLFSCSIFADPDPAGHTVSVSPGTIINGNHWSVTIDDANPIIYFSADAEISSFSARNPRMILTKIDGHNFKGELQGPENAGCGIDVTFTDGTALFVALDITNNRKNTPSTSGQKEVKEEKEVQPAAPSGPVEPAKFATLRSDGSLSCGPGNEWVLKVHSIARQPLFIDTTKPIKSVNMDGVPRFRYEIVSSQCLMVYSQDPSVGRSFKINYTDGTSDEILLRIDTDVLLGDDLVAYQETMFNAFIWGKQQDGYEICYTGEHLLAYQNIISADARSFKNQVNIDSNGVVVFTDTLPEFFLSYDIKNGNFNTKSWFFQFKSLGSTNAFAYYSQKTNHWCIDRNDKSVKALTFATCIGSSKIVDVVQIVFGDDNIELVDTNLQETTEGEKEQVILEEPKEIEISQTPISEVASLEIDVSEEVHISFDPKAAEVVSAAREEQPVSLVVSQKKTEEMNRAQVEALEDKDVQAIVSVELNTSEASIHSFEGGIATVSIPFIVPEGDNPEFYRVYYVSPEGTLTLVNSSYADGEISFSTFHFSDYVVIRSEEPLAVLEPAPEVKEEQPTKNLSSGYIAITIAVVVILGACLVYKKIRK